jgi:hypothetical protein
MVLRHNRPKYHAGAPLRMISQLFTAYLDSECRQGKKK